MKTWRPFLLVCMLLTACVSFTSCDKEESEPNYDSIVGSWYQKNNYDVEIILTFKADRSGVVHYEYPDNAGDSNENFEYSYSPDTNQLTMIGGTQFDGKYNVIMTATKLRMERLNSSTAYEFTRR